MKWTSFNCKGDSSHKITRMIINNYVMTIVMPSRIYIGAMEFANNSRDYISAMEVTILDIMKDIHHDEG